MLKPRLIICVLVLAALALSAILLLRYFRTSDALSFDSVEASKPKLGKIKAYRGPNGNAFLLDHGLPESSAVQDLRLVGRVVDGMQLLFKQLDTRHIATNEQLSDFLTGANHEDLQYLDQDLPIFKDGLLTDRWGQAYIIHPIGTGQIELRTIGADGIPYSDDDIVLRP